MLSIPIVIIVVLSLFSLAAGRTPHANVGTGTFDATTTDWDLSEDPPPADAHEGPALPGDTSEVDPWCANVPSPGPDQTFTYKSYLITGPPTTVPLKADVYLPYPTAGAHFPIMILVHGGGWAKGCRYSMDGVGYSFARGTSPDLLYHVIAVSIDYRLACHSADPVIPTSFKPLCDWTYSRPDRDHGNAAGAAIFDVQDAVSYIRDTWAPNNVSDIWNNKIALVGGSAGGNISFMAATLASGHSRPDALAGWSPLPQFELYVNTEIPTPSTVWGCQSPSPSLDRETNDYENCSVGSPGGTGFTEGGENQYLPCPTPTADFYDSTCSLLYSQGAVYETVNSGTVPPPVFFANGGGPTAGWSPPELAALMEDVNFDTLLTTKGVDHAFCRVDKADHGTRLLPDTCDSPLSGTVRYNTEFFLEGYICTATPLSCNA